MEPAVSVIMPAYNAAATISAAIESLLQQTMRDIEVVIVDDGSTDSTGVIADDYAEKDGRVLVVHQKNAGAYSARLAGIEKASGQYLGFMDADDTVSPNMYEELLAFAREHDLDIAQCEVEGSPDVDLGNELFLTKEAVIKQVIVPRLVYGRGAVTIWDKIYRRGSLQLPFQASNIMMYEDFVFNLQAFASANKVGYLRKGLYRYNINEGSSVRNFRLKNVADLKEAIRFRREIIPTLAIAIPALVDAAWICLNVGNMYRVACSAPVRDGIGRIQKVLALLDLPEVVAAYDSQGRGWVRKILRMYLVVLIIGVAQKAINFLRRWY